MDMTQCPKKKNKNMNNRLFLYSALIFVSILLFDAWDRDYSEFVQEKTNIEQIPETKVKKEIQKTQPITPETPKRKKEKLIHVETDTLKIKISLRDGAIVYAELLDYPVLQGQENNKIKILNSEQNNYVARIGVQDKNYLVPEGFTSKKETYNLSNKESLDITLTNNSEEGIQISKIYSFKKNSHLIEITQKIKNNNGNKTTWRQFTTLERSRGDEGTNFLYTYTGTAYYDETEKFSKVDFDEIANTNLLQPITSGWISMLEHYFLTAWIPYEANNNENSTVYTRLVFEEGCQTCKNKFLIGSVNDYKEISSGEEKVFISRLYVGPKNQKELSNISDSLLLTVDYGSLTFLAAPLFWVLEKLYFLIGNWGWAIVFLTIIIKLLFFKLSETSYRSMAKMKKLNPRMQALKERFGEDKKKYSEALMKMYKEEKVNPLGGCLPILIQIPVFIALYWVLIESVEMRHAPFVAWIEDLSSADPLYILPVLMGASMYIQQKLNPAPVDPMQQKIFMAFPIIFTFLFATFPSGLVLYWLTNNILSIWQQYFINKRIVSS